MTEKEKAFGKCRKGEAHTWSDQHFVQRVLGEGYGIKAYRLHRCSTCGVRAWVEVEVRSHIDSDTLKISREPTDRVRAWVRPIFV